MLGVDGRLYLGHRVAHLYMTGEWPTALVDHKDRATSDLRWDNLRPASKSQNGANMAGRSKRPGALKGACWDRSRGRWRASIEVNYKKIFLGRFETAEEAHSAYVDAAQKYFGEFARAA